MTESPVPDNYRQLAVAGRHDAAWRHVVAKQRVVARQLAVTGQHVGAWRLVVAGRNTTIVPQLQAHNYSRRAAAVLDSTTVDGAAIVT